MKDEMMYALLIAGGFILYLFRDKKKDVVEPVLEPQPLKEPISQNEKSDIIGDTYIKKEIKTSFSE